MGILKIKQRNVYIKTERNSQRKEKNKKQTRCNQKRKGTIEVQD